MKLFQLFLIYAQQDPKEFLSSPTPDPKKFWHDAPPPMKHEMSNILKDV